VRPWPVQLPHSVFRLLRELPPGPEGVSRGCQRGRWTADLASRDRAGSLSILALLVVFLAPFTLTVRLFDAATMDRRREFEGAVSVVANRSLMAGRVRRKHMRHGDDPAESAGENGQRVSPSVNFVGRATWPRKEITNQIPVQAPVAADPSPAMAGQGAPWREPRQLLAIQRHVGQPQRGGVGR